MRFFKWTLAMSDDMSVVDYLNPFMLGLLMSAAANILWMILIRH